MTDNQKTLCVADASGFLGSHIVKTALGKGYRVNCVMRNTTAPDKAPFLKALPGGENLQLLCGDMANAGAFDAPLKGADCIFIACPVPTREMDDEQGYAEIIMPMVDGCLNILRTAVAQDVRTAVICSSTSTINPPESVEIKNEIDHSSDATYRCRQEKYTSAAKTVMEKAAMVFAEEHDLHLSIILATGIVGPGVLPEHEGAYFSRVLKSMLAGGSGLHSAVQNDSASFTHVGDLASMFLAAYEKPDASGRYFGLYESWGPRDWYNQLGEFIQ